MTATRSYSDLSDSATTFDPEEQFDRDIDERMKGMSKEEAVARAIEQAEVGYSLSLTKLVDGVSTYALVFDDGAPPMEFDNNQDAYKHIADRKRTAAARLAIAAADKWDAEQRATTCKHPRALADVCTGPNEITVWSCPDCGASYDSRKGNQVSPGLDSAIQDELDHDPKSIVSE